MQRGHRSNEVHNNGIHGKTAPFFQHILDTRTAIVPVLPEAFQREKINSRAFNSLVQHLGDTISFDFGSSSGRRGRDNELIRGGSLFSGVMGRGSSFLMTLPVTLYPNISIYCSLEMGAGGRQRAWLCILPSPSVRWRWCSNPAFVSFLSFGKRGTDFLCLCSPQVCWHRQLGLGDDRAPGSVPGC